jgi:hypothetical protein
MRIRFSALALLLGAGIIASANARAGDFCKDTYNGFGDELDRLADRVEKIKETAELCRFMRSTSLPVYQSIADRARSMVKRCERGDEMAAFAQSTLEREKARTSEICAKAGM